MLTNPLQKKLTVAFPSYINTLPLLYFLKPNEDFLLIKDTPRKINESLQFGHVDMGLASSLFYAKNYHKFLILPDISISATGKVKSVILYHREPLEKLTEKKIGITPETETSFGLLRLVLEEFLRVVPRYVHLDKRFCELAQEERFELSGYLAIGDEALLLETQGLFAFSTDLAELWLQRTGLPFIFALLVVRKEVAELKRTLIESFLKELFFSRAKGLSNLLQLAEITHDSLSREDISIYLQHLEYDFSGLKQRAFQCFCDLLHKKALIPEIPKLNFFPL